MASKIFASDSLLSFAMPKSFNVLQDDDELIHVMTKDEDFGVVALPFDMETTETEDLSQLIADLAAQAEIDIDECERLSIENDDIYGEVYAINQDEVIYVLGLSGNDERGFAFQITASEELEDAVMAVLETMSIEEE